MNNTYESPELFELGNAEELTLSCSCGTGTDCDCKAKAELMDVAY
ncbi:MAG TPA: lasso RiPP family leader peptide-containing protein [Thermoanaerobaculia bacterium]|nr:lasso RiPP family leader peptide-containing protein [Thermoanaerobaculia bacterium]